MNTSVFFWYHQKQFLFLVMDTEEEKGEEGGKDRMGNRPRIFLHFHKR